MDKGGGEGEGDAGLQGIGRKESPLTPTNINDE